MNVQSIRERFKALTPDPETGMLEIVNASFVADEPAIFGTPNDDWHRREREWYLSESLNVNDIPGVIPAIWKQVAGATGEINSNYGWCIFSRFNGSQYLHAISALKHDKHSRQAVMIYNRPTMHVDSTRNGMRDFICTFATHLLIRDGALHYIVNMRSSDAVFGYKGDRSWHSYVHELALEDLQEKYRGLKLGKLYWNAGSLHVYPRHHHLVNP